MPLGWAIGIVLVVTVVTPLFISWVASFGPPEAEPNLTKDGWLGPTTLGTRKQHTIDD
jgi:hypothetical protein